MIVLTWETQVLCSREYKSGKAMLDALGIDHEGKITDDEAIALMLKELEKPNDLAVDGLIEDTFSRTVTINSITVDLDGVEAHVVPLVSS